MIRYKIIISLLYFLPLFFPHLIYAVPDWVKYSSNPIIDTGPTDAWDSQYVRTGKVIFDGSTYKMWYTGKNRDGRDQIGYATSTDGIDWKKYSENPVLKIGTSSDWDRSMVLEPRVIYDSGKYHMWYMGND